MIEEKENKKKNLRVFKEAHAHHKSRSPHKHSHSHPLFSRHHFSLPHPPQHYHWRKIISKFFQVDQFRAQIDRVIIAIHQHAKQCIDGVCFMNHLFLLVVVLVQFPDLFFAA